MIRDIDAARVCGKVEILYRLLLQIQDDIGDLAIASEPVLRSSFDDAGTHLTSAEVNIRVLRDWLSAVSHGTRHPAEFRKGKLA